MHIQGLRPGTICLPPVAYQGGQVGARASGAGLGGASTHFFSHLKSVFRQNHIPKCA